MSPDAPATFTRPEAVVEPAPQRWPALIDSWRRASHNSQGAARAARFREQLNLPVDRPIIMTGHQLAIWHAGILAKYIACDRAASSFGAAAAWLAVDQDEHEFAALRVPVVDAKGERAVETLSIAEPPPPAGLAVASCPAFDPADAAPRGKPDPPSVVAGIEQTLAAIRNHRRAPSAAGQLAGALTDLMSPLVAPAPVVFASELHRTDLFRSLIQSMADDPRAAVESYNRAALAYPEAGIGPLVANTRTDRFELPLWRIRPGAPRARVFAADLPSIPVDQLAPRALLLTALMRLAACDLFIHGVGGGAYDAVTEQWLLDWLGEELAPKAVVTATLRLPIEGAGLTPADAACADWLAHRARHDPAIIGRADFAARKQASLDRIADRRAASEDAAPEFLAMHAMLAEYRAASAEALARLDGERDRVHRLVRASDIANDRTWPFPWHAPEALRELADEIGARFAPLAAEVSSPSR